MFNRKQYYQKNRIKILKRQKKYDKKHKKHKRIYNKKYHKKYYQKNKKKVRQQQKEYGKQYRQKNKNKIMEKNRKNYFKLKKNSKWILVYYSAKTRCGNPNQKDYKYYGGRGIKFLLTMKEIKFLWFRDKAYLLKRPSIDRKDNNGNYTLKNCRFIELTENCSKRRKPYFKIYQNKIKELEKEVNKWKELVLK